VVDKDSFDRLCDNLHPHSGQRLTLRTKSERTVGYDFSFSVPKSVSMLYALSGDQEIIEAFRSAVDETMRLDIEPEMKTRVRKGGMEANRQTGNMVWAEFIHTTSRPVEGMPDPQLHAHCFVFNSTWDDQEQRWKAGQFRDVKASAPLYQAMFRVRLAGKLQELGFGIQRKRDDFEIAGVPADVLGRFSRRTKEVEKAYEKLLAERLAELGHGEFSISNGTLKVAGVEQSAKEIMAAAERFGITDPKRKAELGAETREAKTHEMSWNELRREWDSRLTDSERQALAAVHRREIPFVRPAKGEGAAVDYALKHSFVRDAVVGERRLLTEALKRGIGSVTVEATKRELARRPLIRGEHAGNAVATTEEMRQAEERMIGYARDGRGCLRPLGDPDRAFTRDWLNDGQKAAVRHVLASRDRVTLVRGPAGTGKTTLEEEMGEALADGGVPVVALAQSTAAVDVLRQEAHFGKADTVARFLRDRTMQQTARDGVVLVDEAGLLGTRDMLGLFDVVENIGARIILVGDKRQNRAVAAGEPLRLLEERAGAPVAEVTEILRQSGDYRQAAKGLSEGRTADAFDVLDKLGWIKEIPDGERYQAMADAYLTAIAERKRGGENKTALAVSPTWAEAARITQAIRGKLKAQDKLGEERIFDIWTPAHLTDAQKADAANIDKGDLVKFHQNAPGYQNGTRLVVGEGEAPPVKYANRFEVFRPSQLAVAEGDRIRLTANGTTKDGKHKLRNGGLMTVRGFTAQGDVIVDHGWVITRDWGHIAAGYAITSEGSQGKTVDKVFVGLSSQSFPAGNTRRFYVPVTRGKEQALVFTDDKQELLKAVQRADEPLSATELFEAQKKKPTLRQRLGKNLALRRRQAAFDRTRERSPADGKRTHSLDRDLGHAR